MPFVHHFSTPNFAVVYKFPCPVKFVKGSYFPEPHTARLFGTIVGNLKSISYTSSCLIPIISEGKLFDHNGFVNNMSLESLVPRPPIARNEEEPNSLKSRSTHWHQD